MKVLFIYSFILLFCNAIYGQVDNTVVVAGQKYKKEIIIQPHQIGAGVTFYAYRLPQRPLEVFFLKVDLTNPNVSMESSLSKDTIGTSPSVTFAGLENVKSLSVRKSYSGHQVIGAVNGDFFNNNELKNGNMQDGIFGNSPTDFGPMLGFEKDNTPYIDNMTFKGSLSWNRRSITINSTNGPRKADQMVLYTSLNGKYTKTNDYGREVVLEVIDENVDWSSNLSVKCKVVKNTTKGDNKIEPNHLVISGHGVAANKLEPMIIGDIVTVKTSISLENSPNLTPYFTSMIGSNIMFLDKGQACSFTSTAGSPTGLAPRTCVGYSEDKKTFFICIIDGYPTSVHRDMPSDSKGITVADLANIMIDAGAYTAMNFDGGGSSYMYIKPKSLPGNKPSELAYTGGRSVRNALTVCSLAPEDNTENNVKLSDYPIYLNPGDNLELLVSSYNKYGDVIKYNIADGVTYNVTGNIGNIDKGVLKSSAIPSQGTIEVNYKGMKSSTPIYVGVPVPSNIELHEKREKIVVLNGMINVALDLMFLKSIRLYSVTGQYICGVDKSNELSVENIESGIYLCEVIQENGSREISKILLTN